MESYEHVVPDGSANSASLKVPYNRLDLHIPLSQPHWYSPVRHLTGFIIKNHTNDKSHLRLISHGVGGRERDGVLLRELGLPSSAQAPVMLKRSLPTLLRLDCALSKLPSE